MTTSETSITMTTLALPTMLVTLLMLRESDALARATQTSKSSRTLTAVIRATSMVDSALQLFKTSITALATDLVKIRGMTMATADTDTATVVTVLVYGATEIFHTKRAPMAVPSKAVVLVVLMAAMVAIAAPQAMDLTMLHAAMVHLVVMDLTMLHVAMAHPAVMVLTVPLAAIVLAAMGIRDLTEATIDEAINGDEVVN